jgi:hypothetical protein
VVVAAPVFTAVVAVVAVVAEDVVVEDAAADGFVGEVVGVPPAVPAASAAAVDAVVAVVELFPVTVLDVVPAVVAGGRGVVVRGLVVGDSASVVVAPALVLARSATVRTGAAVRARPVLSTTTVLGLVTAPVGARADEATLSARS